MTVKIGHASIDENGNATDAETLELGVLTPIVNTTTPSDDVSYIDKVVKVQNTGLNAAYIRTHIAIPKALEGFLYLELDETGWIRQADSTATIDGVVYAVYTYDYNSAVDAKEFTGELLKGVYLAADVDLAADANGNLVFVKKSNGTVTLDSGFVAHTKTADGYQSTVLNVPVASQAIQAQGFDNATTALNSGFSGHPWATP